MSKRASGGRRAAESRPEKGRWTLASLISRAHLQDALLDYRCKIRFFQIPFERHLGDIDGKENAHQQTEFAVNMDAGPIGFSS
jgi:hypothetical protein